MRNVVRTKLMIDEYVNDTDLDISTLPPLLMDEVKLQRDLKAELENAPRRAPLQPLNKDAGGAQQPQVVGRCALVKLESCVQMPTEHLPAAVLAKKSQLLLNPVSETATLAETAAPSAAKMPSVPEDIYNFGARCTLD